MKLFDLIICNAVGREYLIGTFTKKRKAKKVANLFLRNERWDGDGPFYGSRFRAIITERIADKVYALDSAEDYYKVRNFQKAAGGDLPF